MLKQCPSCKRYFDSDTNELCERCQQTAPKVHFSDTQRRCHCGQMFTPFDEEDYTCPKCKRSDYEDMNEEQHERLYKVVREFLYSNPLTPKVKVSERFGVPLKTIDDWINSNKIQEIGEVEMKEMKDSRTSVCSVCGSKTSKGTLCKACEKKISEKMESHHLALKRNAGKGRD